MSYMGILYVETGRFNEANSLLEKLDAECFFGCDEYHELKAHIDALDSGEPVVAEW